MIWIDMEMPDNCYCCILCRHADMFCRRLGKMLDRDDCYDERPENCPLHEVIADEDTISRKQAIEVAMQYCPDDDGSCSKSDRDIRELLDDLENLPPSQPQRTGRWIRVPVANGLDKYRCDKCGHYVTSGEDKNFCPNCGADMQGGAV